MRGRLLAAAVAAAAALAAASVTTGCGGGEGRHPILFVHGFGEDDLLWYPMVERFRQDGWTRAQLNNWTYNPYLPAAMTAREVKAQVARILAATRARKVDLITHAMGSVSTRYYLEHLGGTAKVAHWVSLGGPNHGSSRLETCDVISCDEMHRNAPLLRKLNAGDETPGSVRYLTVRSSCDEYVFPRESVELKGATNVNAGCLSSVGLTTDRRVYLRVREFVR
jgi:triacylglycerol esterase/lipase EstA (alpha/beta hydrolase family)